ncbi:MAG: OB-fold nucleic acid binding domain-containing protein [Acidobacteria bacterium]|nr:OB-fold nucleic acid binding domain-containing protein [Acidobacteriota bacterium]
MKSPFVSELQPNQVVTAIFLVQAKDVRQKKTGEPYLSLTLCDRTGEIDAKMWDNVSEVLETFDRDDFIRVKGMVQVYQNRPQLTIHKLQRIVDESEVDPTDYFPASVRPAGEMFAELEGIIQGIGNPHLKGLLQAMLADPEIARL